MAKMTWGMLGAGRSISERRTRTLEVGGVIKEFNDRAVPDLGNLWYAKQLFLALLGVHIAERAQTDQFDVSNIEVANAIEALACIIAFGPRPWTQHERLLGSTKMRDKTDRSFQAMRQRDFYVTQPMRMGMLQPLLAFGLVEPPQASRFNDYRCTRAGVDLLNTACHGTQLISKLLKWVKGGGVVQEPSQMKILSQLEPLSKDVRSLIKQALVHGKDLAVSPDDRNIHKPQRRSNALNWVEVLHRNPNQDIQLESKPEEIEHDHWNDIQAGAQFTNVRDAAMSVLDAVEATVAQRADRRLPTADLKGAFDEFLAKLRAAAKKFINLDYAHIPDATRFCTECSDADDVQLIINLVKRDERVLRFSQNQIVPGAAFRTHASINSDTVPREEAVPPEGPKWPKGMSYRLRNLYWLNDDLNHAPAQSLLGSSETGVRP